MSPIFSRRPGIERFAGENTNMWFTVSASDDPGGHLVLNGPVPTTPRRISRPWRGTGTSHAGNDAVRRSPPSQGGRQPRQGVKSEQVRSAGPPLSSSSSDKSVNAGVDVENLGGLIQRYRISFWCVWLSLPSYCVSFW